MLQQHTPLLSSSQSVEPQLSRESDAAAPIAVVAGRPASADIVHRAPLAHRCKHRAPRSYVVDVCALHEVGSSSSHAAEAAV